MHSSSALISCVAGRVSLIPPDSCHSPSRCTVVDSDTHRLPRQNPAAVEHALSHLSEDCLSQIHNARSQQASELIPFLTLGFFYFAGKPGGAACNCLCCKHRATQMHLVIWE